MRGQRWFLVAALAALLPGCGDRRLIVRVDVLSYFDPAMTQVFLGPVPAIPGGFYTGEQEIVKDLEVNLINGTNGVAEVHSVSIAMTAIAADSTGAGTDTLRLYLSEIGEDPLRTPPALVMPIMLSPGVTDTVSVDLAGDQRVADLFAGQRVRMTLTTALRGPDSGQDLNARIRVHALDATLIAGRRPSP